MMIENIAGAEFPALHTSSANLDDNTSKTGNAVFEAMFDEELQRGAQSKGSAVEGTLSDIESLIAEIFPLSETNPDDLLGKKNAKLVVEILDKTGFLDKLVDSALASSGKAQWFDEGMRYSLKYEMKKDLEYHLSEMNWSEAMRFLMLLKMRLKQEALGPLGLSRNEEVGNSIYDTVEKNLLMDIEDLAALAKQPTT